MAHALLDPAGNAACRRRGGHQESRAPPIATERHDDRIASDAPLQCPLEDRSQERIPLRTRGRIVHPEDERTSPALDREGSQAAQRQVAAEVLDDGIDRGSAQAVAEALGDTTANLPAHAATEVAHRFGGGVLAQGHQGVGGHEDAPRAATKRDPPLCQVESNLTGGVERRLSHGGLTIGPPKLTRKPDHEYRQPGRQAVK